MPKKYGDERVLATPLPGPLLDEMKAACKERGIRLREGVVEALDLWLSTTRLLEASEVDRRELRTKRLQQGEK